MCMSAQNQERGDKGVWRGSERECGEGGCERKEDEKFGYLRRFQVQVSM